MVPEGGRGADRSCCPVKLDRPVNAANGHPSTCDPTYRRIGSTGPFEIGVPGRRPLRGGASWPLKTRARWQSPREPRRMCGHGVGGSDRVNLIASFWNKELPTEDQRSWLFKGQLGVDMANWTSIAASSDVNLVSIVTSIKNGVRTEELAPEEPRGAPDRDRPSEDPGHRHHTCEDFSRHHPIRTDSAAWSSARRSMVEMVEVLRA
ncbi:hypothetical protein VTN00DRAFT_702 [Thermoascus crustaceus]|uniref:uncharacterized protein n=1 Tax=Thermoascus crustaceus TaxID=5088 RepID=UPI00374218AE